MAGDRQIGKILEFDWVEALICRRYGGLAIGNPIGLAIDLEEPDINQRCYVAIVSLQEVRSLDRD